MIIRFEVPMKPKGKPRARSSGARRYHTSEYEQWRQDFWHYASAQILGMRIEEAFGIDVMFWTPSGKAQSDVDNAIGSILDTLQDVTTNFYGRKIVAESRLFPNDRLCRSGSESYLKMPKERGEKAGYMIEVSVMPAVEHLRALAEARMIMIGHRPGFWGSPEAWRT